MASTSADSLIDAVRRFSRFYTRRIGALEDGLLGSSLTLPQARVIYELGACEQTTAGVLAADLNLDAGYLSRLVGGLEQRGLIERRQAEDDGRRLTLTLSTEGRRLFEQIDARSRQEVGQMLAALDPGRQVHVIESMRAIEQALEGKAGSARAYVLREPRSGDIGWIVHRHGALYAAEYGWDTTFEALVAKVAAEFIETFDPARERCRIADRDGQIAGAAFVVRKSARIAKLRLVYVEPWARGSGLGRALVEDCMRFARQAGYTRMTLWTNDVLIAARRLYETLGFGLIASEPYRGFGHDLVGETWERDL